MEYGVEISEKTYGKPLLKIIEDLGRIENWKEYIQKENVEVVFKVGMCGGLKGVILVLNKQPLVELETFVGYPDTGRITIIDKEEHSLTLPEDLAEKIDYEVGKLYNEVKEVGTK